MYETIFCKQILSSQQLYRICILFGDDNGSDNVPPEVSSVSLLSYFTTTMKT